MHYTRVTFTGPTFVPLGQQGTLKKVHPEKRCTCHEFVVYLGNEGTTQINENNAGCDFFATLLARKGDPAEAAIIHTTAMLGLS